MDDALEALTTVGSVAVTRTDVAGSMYGFEYAVEFQPWEASNLEHFLNYGDMPTIAVRDYVVLDGSRNSRPKRGACCYWSPRAVQCYCALIIVKRPQVQTASATAVHHIFGIVYNQSDALHGTS